MHVEYLKIMRWALICAGIWRIAWNPSTIIFLCHKLVGLKRISQRNYARIWKPCITTHSSTNAPRVCPRAGIFLLLSSTPRNSVVQWVFHTQQMACVLELITNCRSSKFNQPYPEDISVVFSNFCCRIQKPHESGETVKMDIDDTKTSTQCGWVDGGCQGIQVFNTYRSKWWQLFASWCHQIHMTLYLTSNNDMTLWGIQQNPYNKFSLK